jgi:hypothetical protein
VKRVIESMKESAPDGSALDGILKPPAEEQEFIRTLYRKTIEQSEDHGREIAAKASNWELDRIAVSDMILMKMALTEAREFNEIPVKVTVERVHRDRQGLQHAEEQQLHQRHPRQALRPDEGKRHDQEGRAGIA